MKLCELLKTHHTKINLYLDVKRLDDLEFDKLIGKGTSLEDINQEPRPMNEQDINNGPDFLLPIVTKKHSFQLNQFKQDEIGEKLDNRSMFTQFMDQPSMPFNQRCLQMLVPVHRPIH